MASFSSKNDVLLESATETFSSIKQDIFSCKICGKSFNKKAYLRQHNKTHADKIHTCHICFKGFSIKSYLDAHRQTHVPNRKLFKCPICSKMFKHRSSLTTHVKLHTAEKIHKCDLCLKAFKIKHDLYLHRQTHSEKIFTCPICPKAFALNKYLLRHMKIHSSDHDDNVNLPINDNEDGSIASAELNQLNSENLFTCSVCSKVFGENKNLISHMKTHHSDEVNCSFNERWNNDESTSDPNKIDSEKFSCPICAKAFAYNKYLMKHMKIHSSSVQNLFKCPVCPKRFSLKGYLTKHMKRHLKNDKNCFESIKNSEENDIFQSLLGFSDLNCQEEIQISARLFICSICSKTFTVLKLLQMHMKTHTNLTNSNNGITNFGFQTTEPKVSKLKKTVTCRKCFGTFASQTTLTYHKNLQKCPRGFKCRFCNRYFKKDFLLNYHLKEHKLNSNHFELKEVHNDRNEQSDEEEFKCPICFSTFLSKHALNCHTLTHSREKTYECYVCYQKFSLAVSLRNHMRTHFPETSYECDMCDRVFTSKNLLINHTKIHRHENTFECQECSKVFLTKYALDKHLLVHGMITPENKAACETLGMPVEDKSFLLLHAKQQEDHNRFQCSICFKTFYNEYSMTRHVRIHTGEKPFTCNICSRSFSQSGNLATHKLLHSDEKQYVCTVCSRSFKQKSNLLNHRKIHLKSRLVKCPFCPKVYTCDSSLQKHRSRTGCGKFQKII